LCRKHKQNRPSTTETFLFQNLQQQKIEKKFTNSTKDLYQSRRGEKNRSISSPKNRIFFYFGVREQCKTTRSGSAHNKSKAVVGKETTKSSATPCTYTKQTANHLLLNYSSSFFHFCPVNLT
jgi:hypothetical protein